MGRIIKLLFILAILGAVGLAGYAYLGDMRPPVTDSHVPVDLNVTK
ncbi:hypothetical protein [Phaeovulum sp.]